MTRARKAYHCIRIAILAGTVSAAALANPSSALVSVTNTRLCYCRCEQQSGVRHCTKMCELPQYENRWWATVCHKQSSSMKESVTRDSNSNSHSRKTNRTEQARR
jgi:hypothetical protein